MNNLPDLTLDDIADALHVIDYNDREIWVQMGMAIKAEYGEAGFGVWDNWSADSDSYNPKDAKTVWRSFKGNKIGIGTLIAEARRNGFEFKPGELSKEEKRRRKAEARARRKELEERAQRDEVERQAWHERVSMMANRLVDERVLDTSGISPYLQRKKVMAFGLFFVPRAFLLVTDIEAGRIDLVTERDAITAFFERNNQGDIDTATVTFRYIRRGTVAVPMRDVDGKLWGFQFIFETGKKVFAKFGRKQGLFHLCVPPGEVAAESKPRPPAGGHLLSFTPDVLAVAEGYATAASVLQARHWPVAVAFDSGNLPPVAAAFRGVYPDSTLVICGDDDCETRGNPGRRKAQEAAQAVSGVAVFPDFSFVQQEASG